MSVPLNTTLVSVLLLVFGLALGPVRSQETPPRLVRSPSVPETISFPPLPAAIPQALPENQMRVITLPLMPAANDPSSSQASPSQLRSSSTGPVLENLPFPRLQPEVVAPGVSTPARAASESWWEAEVMIPLQRQGRPASLSLENAVLETFSHSPQVKALSDQALVREYAIREAASKFDVTNFVNSRFNGNSDAVGNTLTTGGPSQFIDTNWNTTGGVRKLQASGGKWEASQQLGWQDTNSIYFVPGNQATTKMLLTYTQPLLKGAGCEYQNSVIVLAELNAAMGSEQLSRELQEIVVNVHRNYWDLFLNRAAYLQRRRLYLRAQKIHEELIARQDVDTLTNQIVRAKAALRDREAAMVRYSANAKNAESALLTLIGARDLPLTDELEVVPIQPPRSASTAPELQLLLTRALEYRPEVQQALKNIKAATVRLRMAENEIKPNLNMVLGSYLNGLQGDSDIAQSFANQFSTGRPSAFVGMEYERPVGNRAAKSRLDQRQVEVRQVTYELENVTNQVRKDVVIAHREIQATAYEVGCHEQAVRAFNVEIDYLTNRWRLLPGEGQEAGVVLDNILQAQQRLADAELALVTAEVNLSMAHVQLLRATGELIRGKDLQPGKLPAGGEPIYSLPPLPGAVPRGPALGMPNAPQ